MNDDYSYFIDSDYSINGRADLGRHWCGKSQSIAGADNLLMFLNKGYKMRRNVFCEYKYFRGNRRTEIYHFHLTHSNGQSMVIPVLCNPFVLQLIHQLNLIVSEEEMLPSCIDDQ